jgi:hypothetical protein
MDTVVNVADPADFCPDRDLTSQIGWVLIRIHTNIVKTFFPKRKFLPNNYI